MLEQYKQFGVGEGLVYGDVRNMVQTGRQNPGGEIISGSAFEVTPRNKTQTDMMREVIIPSINKSNQAKYVDSLIYKYGLGKYGISSLQTFMDKRKDLPPQVLREMQTDYYAQVKNVQRHFDELAKEYDSYKKGPGSSYLMGEQQREHYKEKLKYLKDDYAKYSLLQAAIQPARQQASKELQEYAFNKEKNEELSNEPPEVQMAVLTSSLAPYPIVGSLESLALLNQDNGGMEKLKQLVRDNMTLYIKNKEEQEPHMEHFRDDTMIAKLKKMQVIDMIIAKRLEASGEELKQDPKDIFKVTMPLLQARQDVLTEGVYEQINDFIDKKRLEHYEFSTFNDHIGKFFEVEQYANLVDNITAEYIDQTPYDKELKERAKRDVQTLRVLKRAVSESLLDTAGYYFAKPAVIYTTRELAKFNTPQEAMHATIVTELQRSFEERKRIDELPGEEASKKEAIQAFHKGMNGALALDASFLSFDPTEEGEEKANLLVHQFKRSTSTPIPEIMERYGLNLEEDMLPNYRFGDGTFSKNEELKQEAKREIGSKRLKMAYENMNYALHMAAVVNSDQKQMIEYQNKLLNGGVYNTAQLYKFQKALKYAEKQFPKKFDNFLRVTDEYLGTLSDDDVRKMTTRAAAIKSAKSRISPELYNQRLRKYVGDLEMSYPAQTMSGLDMSQQSDMSNVSTSSIGQFFSRAKQAASAALDMLLNPEHREEMGKILINSKDMIKNLVRGSAASFGFNPLLVEKFLEYSGPYVDKFVRRSAYLEQKLPQIIDYLDKNGPEKTNEYFETDLHKLLTHTADFMHLEDTTKYQLARAFHEGTKIAKKIIDYYQPEYDPNETFQPRKRGLSAILAREVSTQAQLNKTYNEVQDLEKFNTVFMNDVINNPQEAGEMTSKQFFHYCTGFEPKDQEQNELLEQIDEFFDNFVGKTAKRIAQQTNGNFVMATPDEVLYNMQAATYPILQDFQPMPFNVKPPQFGTPGDPTAFEQVQTAELEDRAQRIIDNQLELNPHTFIQEVKEYEEDEEVKEMLDQFDDQDAQEFTRLGAATQQFDQEYDVNFVDDRAMTIDEMPTNTQQIREKLGGMNSMYESDYEERKSLDRSFVQNKLNLQMRQSRFQPTAQENYQDKTFGQEAIQAQRNFRDLQTGSFVPIELKASENFQQKKEKAVKLFSEYSQELSEIKEQLDTSVYQMQTQGFNAVSQDEIDQHEKKFNQVFKNMISNRDLLDTSNTSQNQMKELLTTVQSNFTPTADGYFQHNMANRLRNAAQKVTPFEQQQYTANNALQLDIIDRVSNKVKLNKVNKQIADLSFAMQEKGKGGQQKGQKKTGGGGPQMTPQQQQQQPGQQQQQQQQQITPGQQQEDEDPNDPNRPRIVEERKSGGTYKRSQEEEKKQPAAQQQQPMAYQGMQFNPELVDRAYRAQQERIAQLNLQPTQEEIAQAEEDRAQYLRTMQERGMVQSPRVSEGSRTVTEKYNNPLREVRILSPEQERKLLAENEARLFAAQQEAIRQANQPVQPPANNRFFQNIPYSFNPGAVGRPVPGAGPQLVGGGAPISGGPPRVGGFAMRGGPPGPQNLSENDQLRQQLQELLKQKKMLESNVRMAEGRKDRRHTTGRPFWGVADRRKYMQMRNAILSRLQPLLHHRLRQERRMLQTRKQMRRIGKHLKPIKKDKKKGKKKKGGKRRGDDDEEMTKKEIEDEYRQANDERRRPSRFDKYEDDEY